MTEPFIDNAALANDDPQSRARHLAIKLGWVTQERDEYQAGLTLLRWLHAEACWQRDAERASRQDWAADAADLEMILSKTLGEPDGALELAGVAPDRTRPEISLDDLLAAEAAKLAGER